MTFTDIATPRRPLLVLFVLILATAPPNATAQTGYVALGPTGSQTVTQPSGTNLNVNNLNASNSNVLNAKAPPFNATGNGTTDDTAAINACIAATANFRPNGGSEAAVCYLPQGQYRITQPLIIALYGSLIGAGEGSVIVADFAHWNTSHPYYAINMAFSGQVPSDQISANRRLSNFYLYGTGNSSLTTWGIFEGNSSNVDNQLYQLTFDVDHVSINQFDTAMEWQDLSNSVFKNNTIQNVRDGIVFNGNVVNITMTGNVLNYSNWAATGNHVASNALLLENNSKYTSGTEGTYPEGIMFDANTIVAWDTDINAQRCVSCTFIGNVIDSGGAGPVDSSAGTAVTVGQTSDEIQISKNYIAIEPTNAVAVMFQAEQSDGMYIDDNWILGFSTGQVGVSISPQGGSPLNFTTIRGNFFRGFQVGINFQGSMNKSLITGNVGYGFQPGGQLINLENVDFTGTIIDHNINGDSGGTSVMVGSSTNAIIGYNWTYSNGTNPGQELPNVQRLTFTGGQVIADDSAGAGYDVSFGASSTYGLRFWKGTIGTTQIGQIDPSGNFYTGNGRNVVYRCAASGGSLPVGALTITAAECSGAVDTGLRVK